MQVQAKAKFIRMAPRKTRLLVALVRGMSITRARQQLLASSKAAAKPVLKVLDSAVANAKNNHALDVTDFYVTQAYVDEGPKFYRYTPRAHGRATPIRKRSSHITVMIGPKEEIGKLIPKLTKKQLAEAKKTRKAASVQTETAPKKKTAKKAGKPAAKKKTKTKSTE